MDKLKAIKVIALAALLIVVGVVTSSAAPRMVIPESKFDFGYVPQNSKISHSFWIKSEGDDSLKILKVVPG